ncbi:MAG: tetratricopeptide repeat protein [Hydrotalea flava]|nr:tetratricopeptide repeat protein [Hydrotalea flava]NIM36459.1 tetratricopeptide repeat protein [Hydrotalea flava]NIM39317.1 tetratricopeptide repeat protein [Hydrotalea flava]NIN04243.1 tetratricopeptide repeat protein [Hydrotalea flava]NIN16178.1 tetratricopeptide repeat protein [Hydrotalea flava]
MVAGAVVVVVLLFVFGKVSAPKSSGAAASMEQQTGAPPAVQFKDILQKARKQLNPEQNQRIIALENAITRGDVKDQQLHVYHQLAKFWKDSAHVFEPYAYYTAQAAKLENSEKSLTFAAQLFVDNLLTENNPAMQHWLAENAKDLLDRALVINPNNDSSKIGLGACYMFGNISDNPMQGILPVREIAQKDSNNLYAQMVLGLGGKKSGQLDKAIERFQFIVRKDPHNLEAIFQLAETYDMQGDKAHAIQWYETAKRMINNDAIKKEIDKRINELK